MLFVDDERSLECELPGYDIDYARNVNAAINCWIHNPNYDEIWLDHDLGEDGGNIMELIRSLEMYGFYFPDNPKPEIVVHSMNPVGAENIVGKLSPYYNVKRIPYSTIMSSM